ncbi:hypothetical protein A3I48_02045 [Candidatus Daviesbacteria bacterium RIFCSPLOWO2_02_FULL_36_7]|uniref:Glycoside hydrolase family 5 domain-containing protein n=1 Tax=Candidatus Daviesbacteria bacterium RIFCSPLOWO2_02_FULL_36_7 TaxID=1797792 RepID=A0A1F5MGN4_9BACT|nr:MAG: hypothetical protein A3I48_02045 [Candidatus Daviesbacteria bacterium RIFCSPLOWO2_02_FULL_36_7]
MKKLIKILGIVVGIIVLVTLIMAIFSICPPKGPWPTPPWCKDRELKNIGDFERDVTIKVLEEQWKKISENDRGYFVRGKPAFSVIQQEFQAPYIKAGMISITWPCNRHAMSEKEFLKALEEEIVAMKKMNVNTVMVRVAFQQDTDYTKSAFIESTYGFSDKTVCDRIPYKKMDTTFSPEIMGKIFRKIHENNLMVLLEFSSFVPEGSKEGVEPWRGNVWAIDLTKFFSEYLERMIPYAKVAEQEDVEIIRIATEIEVIGKERNTIFNATGEERIKERNTLFREKIIPSIRKEYKGLLTYGENFQVIDQVDFWDKLDYIGIDFYIAFTNKNDPTVTELESSIKGLLNKKILPLQQKYNKPVYFAELGYRSYDGDNRRPYEGEDAGRSWIDIHPDSPVDHQEQANEFNATFNVGKDIPWIYGYAIWSPGYEVAIGHGLKLPEE